MPKYGTDKKEQNIKVRLNDEMRRHVEKAAYGEMVNMSEYIRMLIKADMRKNPL